MTFSVRSLRGPRRIGAVAVGLALAASAVGLALANFSGTTTIYSGQFPNPVVAGQTADYTLSFSSTNNSDRSWQVSAVSGTTGLSVTPLVCYAHHGSVTNYHLDFHIKTSTTTPVGSHNITVTVSEYNGNNCTGGAHDTDTVNTTLVVSSNVLYVVPDAKAVTYGDPVPTYSFVLHQGSTGGTVVSSGSLSGYTAPVCTSSYTSSTSVSSSPLTITCSGGAATGYTFNTTSTAQLTIAKATLFVVPNVQGVIYGGAVPAYTFVLHLGSAGGTVVSPAGIAGYTAPVCTSSYTTGTPVSASPLTISCSGGSATNYNFNTAGTAQLSIGKATGVLGFDLSSMSAQVYGSGTFGVAGWTTKPAGDTGAITFATAAGSVGCSVSPTGTVTLTGAAVGASFCRITASLAADANFTAGTPITQSFHIGQAVLTVTPDAQSVTYGDSAPTYTVQVTGFVNGDTAATAAGYVAPTCGSAYTSSTPVSASPVTIDCTGGSAADYTFDTSATAPLTIGQADLDITASNETITFGDPAPTVTPIYVGLTGGDAQPATPPVCSADLVTRITSCAGAVDPNYDITYHTGTLTVNPAMLFVVPANKTVTYGDPAPAYTYSLHLGSAAGAVVAEGSIGGYAAPTCGSAYTSSTPVTSSPLVITCSGGVGDDYLFDTASTASLTINPVSSLLGFDLSGMAGPTYGEASFSVAGMAGKPDGDSGDITFALGAGSKGCSVTADGVVTITGAAEGSDFCVIEASLAGDGNFTADGPVAQAFHIGRAALTVTPDAKSVNEGDPAPAYTFSVTGWVNGDTSGTAAGYVAPTCDSSYNSSTPASSSPVSITCSGGGADDYTFSYGSSVVAIDAPAPTAAPTQVVGGETGAPSIAPTEIVGGETSVPTSNATPPSSSTDGSSSNDSGSIFALLICIAFGGLGILAIKTQRRSIRI
jgi:hypothetical protein